MGSWRPAHGNGAAGPLSSAGIAWFSIDYRLAKDPISFGVAVRDVESAVRFVTDHAAEYNIDPGRIALIGESAGGHLAAMAAINPALTIKTAVVLYAPTDLASLVQNKESLLPDSVRENLTGTLWGGLILARLSQLSPIDHLRPGMPPFLLIHGTNDPLVPYPAIARYVRQDESSRQHLRSLSGRRRRPWNAPLEIHRLSGGNPELARLAALAFRRRRHQANRNQAERAPDHGVNFSV